MKAESTAFLQQAAIMLERADLMLSVELNEDAARTAYLACFHVAQAYIFERTDKVSKSPHGVQFVHGYAESEQDNIRDDELAAFKLLAVEMMGYDDEALAKARANGTLTEILFDE